MKLLIHGEDTVDSRRKLDEKKHEHDQFELISIDGKHASLTDLVTAVESSSLFSNKRMIILENLFSGVLTKEKEAILTYLSSVNTDNCIIVWEGSEISKRLTGKYCLSWIIYSFPFPQILFKFLDSIGGVSSSSLLMMFRSLLTQKEAALIHSMLTRQFRMLILAKDMGTAGFPELQSWQARKFLQQAGYFTLSQLINNYRELLSIEYKLKTGQTPYTLSALLDIFIATL